jgi:hypothetical protein
MYPQLSDAMADRVISEIRRFFNGSACLLSTDE